MRHQSIRPCVGWRALVALALSLCLTTAGWAQDQADEAREQKQQLTNLGQAFSAVAEEASPAVVFIEVEKQMGGAAQSFGPGNRSDLFEHFFGPGAPMPPQQRGRQQPGGGQQWRQPFGQGSGFIISEDGYIMTNHHVIGEADRVNVQLGDGRDYIAEIVGSDPLTEIALLKIEAADLPYLEFGSVNELQIGEWVVAIGSPFGLSHSVTAGIVSAKGRGNVGIVDYADFIQTDAAINPGNSGGPLINLDSEVVGMNTAILSRSGGYMGIGFAIPVNMLQYIRDQLLEEGEIARGFLGIAIQDLDSDLAEWFDVPGNQGVLIAEVREASPAAEAGLQQNDVIVELQGEPVRSAGSFSSRISTTAPGTRVSLGLVRDGERIEQEVELGSLTAEAMAAAPDAQEGRETRIGLAVQNLTPELAEQLGYEADAGVVVTEVQRGSAAARAGLETGTLIREVNREEVANVSQFKEALKAGEDKQSVLLLVQRGEMSRYLTLEIE